MRFDLRQVSFYEWSREIFLVVPQDSSVSLFLRWNDGFFLEVGLVMLSNRLE